MTEQGHEKTVLPNVGAENYAQGACICLTARAEPCGIYDHGVEISGFAL